MSVENIKITKKARDYLIKKGKLDIVIEFPSHRLSSESVVVPLPEIFSMKPKNLESYQKTSIDGIDLYISNSVKMPSNDIVIDLDSFLGIKTINLYGFKLSEL